MQDDTRKHVEEFIKRIKGQPSFQVGPLGIHIKVADWLPPNTLMISYPPDMVVATTTDGSCEVRMALKSGHGVVLRIG